MNAAEGRHASKQVVQACAHTDVANIITYVL